MKKEKRIDQQRNLLPLCCQFGSSLPHPYSVTISSLVLDGIFALFATLSKSITQISFSLHNPSFSSCIFSIFGQSIHLLQSSQFSSLLPFASLLVLITSFISYFHHLCSHCNLKLIRLEGAWVQVE